MRYSNGCELKFSPQFVLIGIFSEVHHDPSWHFMRKNNSSNL